MSAVAPRLVEIATARAGDKGDDSLIAAYANSDVGLMELTHWLTPSRVAAHFDLSAAQVVVTVISRHSCVALHLRDRLTGGVTRSTSSDPHGKTLAFHLLDMPLTRISTQ